MKAKDYDRSVLKTEAIDFTGIKKRLLRPLLEVMVVELATVRASCLKLDQVKKHLFYGKAIGDNLDSGDQVHGLSDRDLRLLHGLLGLLTESTEMIDGLRIDLSEKITMTPDLVNVSEEVGDMLWYASVLCQASESGLDVAMVKNIAKLKKRYGRSFSEKKAINRDIGAERKILEKK